MTTAVPPTWAASAGPPRRSWGAGRVVALVVGLVLLLPGLGLLLGGGTLLWADWTSRDDGFVVSPEDVFASQGYALVSERIDLRTDADWLPVSAAFGTARVEVTGPGQEEIFVGIGPAADVEAYLGGVQRTVIDDLGFDQPATGGDQRPGGAPAGPPGGQDFWTAETAGAGTQELTWDPAEGDWMLVVMNADGSAGLLVEARVGAEFPALAGLGWGLTVAGVLVTVIAVLLLVIAARTPRDRRLPGVPQPASVPPPRGPAAAETWGPAPPVSGTATAPGTAEPREPGDRTP
jgi:hypothetical protein